MFMNIFIHRLALLYNLKIFSISESCDDMVVDYECMCVCVELLIDMADIWS
jgi:hypothetical protein